jgi:hypothetical protein
MYTTWFTLGNGASDFWALSLVPVAVNDVVTIHIHGVAVMTAEIAAINTDGGVTAITPAATIDPDATKIFVE